jgi:hypothetical protein
MVAQHRQQHFGGSDPLIDAQRITESKQSKYIRTTIYMSWLNTIRNSVVTEFVLSHAKI